MSARDELAKVIYEYTPLMTVIQDAHRIADAVIAAGWKSPEPSAVSAINSILGVNLWDAPSFRADVRIDFDEFGHLIGASLLNPIERTTP